MTLAERRKVTGIGPSRAEIIVPGAAVLSYVLEAFGLPSVYYSAAGVRDGIVADLAARGVGREYAELSRDQRKEVERIGRKYGVAHSPTRAKWRNWRACSTPPCSRSTASRPATASCWRPPPSCTTWGIT